jgi:hypothetical protein
MDPAIPFLKDPERYPHAMDAAGDRLAFVRLTREALRAASFLDERVLAPGDAVDWAAWPDVAGAVPDAGLQERCGFIFHIGHVGSTLLSRLVEAHPGLLSLREPLPLRTLAQAQAWEPDRREDRLATMLKLWSRPFAPGQLPIVKATSYCSGMAAELLARPSEPRAILMRSAPEPWLANLFAGEDNRLDIAGQIEARIARMNRSVGEGAFRLSELSYPQAASLSWACETMALKAAADARPGQALWLDFERFLRRPQSQLRASLEHFGVAASDEDVAAIIAGPDMGRYSKAPEHAYDSGLRAQILAQARTEHAPAIAQALAWLDEAAARYPAIARALEAAGAV